MAPVHSSRQKVTMHYNGRPNPPVDFWATVCRTVRQRSDSICYRTVVCPVCLSVTLVYCGHLWMMDQDATWYRYLILDT